VLPEENPKTSGLVEPCSRVCELKARFPSTSCCGNRGLTSQGREGSMKVVKRISLFII